MNTNKRKSNETSEVKKNKTDLNAVVDCRLRNDVKLVIKLNKNSIDKLSEKEGDKSTILNKLFDEKEGNKNFCSEKESLNDQHNKKECESSKNFSNEKVNVVVDDEDYKNKNVCPSIVVNNSGLLENNNKDDLNNEISCGKIKENCSNDKVLSLDNENTDNGFNMAKNVDIVKNDDVNKKEKMTREMGLELCKMGDSLRDRCCSLFYQAFADMISDVDYRKAVDLAKRIENYLYETGKINNPSFVRSKYLNLKNKGNNLAERIYKGVLDAKRYVDMSMDEMKSDELKAEEEQIVKNALYDARMAEDEAETDIFQCSRCKQRKCSYRQLQTRSADEPMTTFVKCKCGHAWKFS